MKDHERLPSLSAGSASTTPEIPAVINHNKLLGSGCYAKVYAGQWNGIEVAVKVPLGARAADRDRTRQEIRLWRYASGSRIVLARSRSLTDSNRSRCADECHIRTFRSSCASTRTVRAHRSTSYPSWPMATLRAASCAPRTRSRCSIVSTGRVMYWKGTASTSTSASASASKHAMMYSCSVEMIECHMHICSLLLCIARALLFFPLAGLSALV